MHTFFEGAEKQFGNLFFRLPEKFKPESERAFPALNDDIISVYFVLLIGCRT